MNISQLSVGDVRINLRGLDIGVAEHDLNASDIGAILEEIGGERMA